MHGDVDREEGGDSDEQKTMEEKRRRGKLVIITHLNNIESEKK